MDSIVALSRSGEGVRVGCAEKREEVPKMRNNTCHAAPPSQLARFDRAS